MNALFRSFFLLLPLCALVLTGCGPTATLQGVRPPEIALPGVRTAHLQSFEGRFALSARPCFIEEFLRSGRVSLVPGPEADVSLRLEVAEDIDEYRTHDSVTWEREYTRTIERTLPDGRKETIKETLTEPVLRQVPRVERSVVVRGTLTAFGPQGAVLASATDERRSDESFGGRSGWSEKGTRTDPATYDFDVPPARLKASDLACRVGRDLAGRVVPQHYILSVALADEGDEVLARGAQLASQGRWEQAAALWRQVLEKTPGMAGALYNMGVYHEAKGTEKGMLEARSYYDRAAGAAQDADIRKNATEGRSRAARRLEELRQLRAQFPEAE